MADHTVGLQCECGQSGRPHWDYNVDVPKVAYQTGGLLRGYIQSGRPHRDYNVDVAQVPNTLWDNSMDRLQATKRKFYLLI